MAQKIPTFFMDGPLKCFHLVFIQICSAEYFASLCDVLKDKGWELYEARFWELRRTVIGNIGASSNIKLNKTKIFLACLLLRTHA